MAQAPLSGMLVRQAVDPFVLNPCTYFKQVKVDLYPHPNLNLSYTIREKTHENMQKKLPHTAFIRTIVDANFVLLL